MTETVSKIVVTVDFILSAIDNNIIIANNTNAA